MRRKSYEIMDVPPEFSSNGTPEYPKPPDEFNLNAPVVKPVKERGRARKIMLYLAAAGLFAVGCLVLLPEDARQTVQTVAVASAAVQTPAPANTDALTAVSIENRTADPTAAPDATQETTGDVTPEPTGKATPEPSGEATPEPTQTPTATPEPTQAPTATPESTPGVDTVFFRTSQVYHTVLKLSKPEQIESVSFTLHDPITGNNAEEITLTQEEIASGLYEHLGFDANGFLAEQMGKGAYVDLNTEPTLTLETSVTYRTGAGEETRTGSFEPAELPWIGVNYDTEEDVGGIVELMYGTVYPNCFVVRVEESQTDSLHVVFGDDPDVLDAGDVLITITANGKLLTGEYPPTEVLPYSYDGKSFCNYVFAIPRPESFPEHGTATVRIAQKLSDGSYTYVKERTIDY